ncbi:hypothetical protein [Halomonas sp. LBP4]|uniref:hypothetical protein n=1 Tax=Halomonas sp. LBP4 TaxID=2044917 RepID=UPI0015E8B9FC|nr:hypothetical protein [Halomonas sp. LBP4]
MKPSNRKPRARNIIPSARRQRELYQMLDHRADAGDVDAAGWLLFLAEQRGVKAAQP